MLDRRSILIAGAGLVPFAQTASAAPDRFAELERRSGGRLGVMALDTGSGRRLAHRADEPFPMASTFKWLLTAMILAKVDQGHERLDRRIPYGKADLLEYAPTTTRHVGEGAMSLNDLCEAAVTLSDNTAANLMLTTVGGPAGLTRWLRGIGDGSTRLDRNEPTLNEAIPGDPRDTTTPRAMLGDLQRILLGPVLSPASRVRLTGWLVANTTGDAKLRAGVPKDWRVGDKTGNGSNGSSNDVGILWPPGRKPILVAAYLTNTRASGDVRNATLSGVARIASGAR